MATELLDTIVDCDLSTNVSPEEEYPPLRHNDKLRGFILDGLPFVLPEVSLPIMGEIQHLLLDLLSEEYQRKPDGN